MKRGERWVERVQDRRGEEKSREPSLLALIWIFQSVRRKINGNQGNSS